MTAKASSRLDLRLNFQTKTLIENAAHFLGITTSAFVLMCAMERATTVLTQAQVICLNDEESQRFLSILENPPAPNKNLKQLFSKHQKK